MWNLGIYIYITDKLTDPSSDPEDLQRDNGHTTGQFYLDDCKLTTGKDCPNLCLQPGLGPNHGQAGTGELMAHFT